MKKSSFLKKFAPMLVGAFLMLFLFPMAIHANPSTPHGFGDGYGREAPTNENDYHTSVWDRFSFNYQFRRGANHRYELGRPTTFAGSVPHNVFTANIRRDANVSFFPPAYGVFSGIIPTMPSNPLIPQPVNPHFWMPWETHNPNVISHFDTLQHGANLRPQGNALNMFHVSHGEGFLPHTSIGLSPEGTPPSGW